MVYHGKQIDPDGKMKQGKQDKRHKKNKISKMSAGTNQNIEWSENGGTRDAHQGRADQAKRRDGEFEGF